MQQPFLFALLQQNLWLSADRYIFWEQEKVLIVSDLHFGKTGHFRKNGIAVPQDIFKEDIQRLLHAITHYKPQMVIAVGDLFHSHANKELDLFCRWRRDIASVHFTLVKGNHDILDASWYAMNAIEVIKEKYTLNCFQFIHDVQQSSIPAENNLYTFSGHVHPAVRIHGTAKQSLTFPCFYFTKDQAILPAFSQFSGMHILQPKKKDQVFAIINQSVIQL